VPKIQAYVELKDGFDEFEVYQRISHNLNLNQKSPREASSALLRFGNSYFSPPDEVFALRSELMELRLSWDHRLPFSRAD